MYIFDILKEVQHYYTITHSAWAITYIILSSFVY